MDTALAQTRQDPLEKRSVMVGLLLSGVVIAVVAVSYLMNSEYPIRWLVWVIGVAFAAVAVLLIEWPRAYRGSIGEIPTGTFQQLLLISMPLGFVLDSQICGLGLKSCTILCNVISFSMIGLSTVTAFRIQRGQSIGAFVAPMVVVGLIPHCTCVAPINTIFQNVLGGYAPTCQVMPLAASLLRQIKTKEGLSQRPLP
jgi:hypothetical protein